MTTARGGARRSQVLRKHAAVPLRADGGLRLVVVADTHSAPHPAAAGHIAAARPDLIVHAGDIGDLAVLGHFAELAPVLAVRGNIDERGPDLPDELVVDLGGTPGAGALRLLVLHIAVNGPRLRADALRRARATSADLVVCGHSHVPFVGRDQGLVVFNPGSVGPRRNRLPIVFGVLEITGGAMQVRHVDCETGAAWTPGA